MAWLIIVALVILEIITLVDWSRQRRRAMVFERMLTEASKKFVVRNPLGTPVAVVSVERVADVVLQPEETAYTVTLSCGCSCMLIEPPDTPPAVGAPARCYSFDGSHIRLGGVQA